MLEEIVITDEQRAHPLFPITQLHRIARKRGRKEGRLAGMRTIVAELATRRCELLLDQIRQRVDQASEAELLEMCKQLTDFRAETLGELLSGQRGASARPEPGRGPAADGQGGRPTDARPGTRR